MAIENLHNFLYDYFSANHCIVTSDGRHLDVQLTDVLDEKLMNRPFYWQYVRKLGMNGEPQMLKLSTEVEDPTSDRELIHFGTPRLQQIYSHLQEQGKFVRLYQKLVVNNQTPLIPWLVLNIKISFIGKEKKEELRSIGINMINGVMINQMIESLEKIDWESSICDYCYPISPLIRLRNSYQRIIDYLTEQIKIPEHDWAIESWKRMQEEKELLAYFYKTSSDIEKDLYQKEENAIEALYQPRIEFEIVNGGIFHISKSTNIPFTDISQNEHE